METHWTCATAATACILPTPPSPMPPPPLHEAARDPDACPQKSAEGWEKKEGLGGGYAASIAGARPGSDCWRCLPEARRDLSLLEGARPAEPNDATEEEREEGAKVCACVRGACARACKI